jgi:hypothetical protein
MKKLLLDSRTFSFVLILMLSTFCIQAATITSTATGGNWTSGSTWIGGVAPGSGDAVIIATTGTNRVNIASTITQNAAGSVTVNSGAILTMSSNTQTFGALTVNSGGLITIRRSTTILGATNITGRINFGSTSTFVRTINFNGAVTLNAGAIWDETNAGASTVADIYVIKNNFTNNATTFTPLTASPHNFTVSGTLSGSTISTMPRATFTGTYTNNGKLTCATLLTVTGVTLTNNGTITAATSLAGSGGITQGTAGILNIGGTSTITTLTATASGNTVNYTGAAQSIHTGNYSNLNFSGSGVKTLATGTTTIGSLSLSGTATTTTVVNLAVTNSLTVNAGTTFTNGNNFTLGVGGTASVTGSLVLGGTGAKTFTGDVLLNSGGVWNESGAATINFGGNLTNNATTFTANTGAHNFAGATKIISGTTTTTIPTSTFTGAYTINSVYTSSTLITVTGVAVTNNGTLTASASLTGTGSLIQGTTGILNIGAAIGITTLNASAAGNTVNYTGAAQTAYVTTYSNLILSGSLAKTFATTPTINAVLSMEGTATVIVTAGAISYGTAATLQYNTATSRTASTEEWISPFVAGGGIIVKNTGAITTPGVIQIGNNTSVPLNINSGATLTPGANLIIFHGDFINNGTITGGSGGITIAGTTATQSIDDFTTTGAVALTKTTGTATMTGNANGGSLTINGSGGTLNLGVGLTHTFTGIVTLSAGTLNGGSSILNENAVSTTAWNGTGSVFVPATGTVNFGAAGNQTIAANSSFYNLGFSGSGVKTLSNATTINNNFSISGTAVANLGTGLTHSAISLNLGGAAQVIGTWGSTASTAVNKNATWFGSTATGIININCSAPSAPTSSGNRTICSGTTIPALMVTISGGQIVNWYNQASGGTLLLASSTSYTPSVAGTYYAETRVSATGCLSATRTAVVLTINSNPTVLSLTGSTICSSPGGNGIVSSTASQIGINYQLYNSGNAAVQTAKSGTGAALNWTALSAGNGYYIIGTNATTGCFSTSAAVNVSTNPTPTALVLTGSSTCTNPGGDGTITSATSQSGIQYQLYDSGNAMVEAPEIGTGSAIVWTDLDAGNGYYVLGTNLSTGCVSSNSNSVNINNLPNPTALVLTGSTICASPGGNGTITSTTSVVGIEYQLIDDSGDEVGDAIPGTGSAITFTALPAGTGYYVESFNTTTSCVSVSSNLVDVSTNANPTNKTVTVSLASVCSGTGANIIVAGSLASENYQLRNDSGNANIGSPVTGTGSSINLPSGNLTVNTTFNVLATTTAIGCTTELTTNPTITIKANNTAASPSSSPTLCVNTAIAPNITIATTGATGIGTATGLPGGVTAIWSSNTITISGTPTAAGTFNYSIPLTGGCASVNAAGTITVNSSSTAPIGISGTTTICSGNSTTLTVNGGTLGAGATVQWFTGSCGGTAAGTGNSITVSPGSTTTYYVRYIGTCNTTACASQVVTVNPKATASVISGSTTICSGSSTNLQVAITGGTSPFTVVHSGGTVNGYTSGANIPVSPASTTVYALTSVTDANGCIGTGNSGSATVIIDTTTSTNGGVSWSNGAPSGTKSVVFDGATATIGADLSACSLRLTNNATVTVSSGFNVSLNGKLTVDSGSTFTLNNNANLMQNTTLANSGNIVVRRNSSALKRLDYTLWSSPVTGQGLYAFSPFTFANRFYVYNTATNLFGNSVGFNVTGLNPDGVNGADANTIPFASAKAYLIRMPWNHPTAATIWNGTFIGVPNNGNVSFALAAGYNAVGNPYPSRINIRDFIDGNANISGPLYFWRKTNDTSSSSYATLTKTAYVANGALGGDTGTGFFNPGNEANWVINIGQGFIVNATSSTNLSFTNSMRRSSNANQFFRIPPTTETTVSGLYWLNLNADTGIYSQMAIGYSAEGTLAEDRGIDGKNINPDFYLTSLIGTDEYSIQGRPDFDSADIVPLSYKVTVAGNYTITIDHTSGMFDGNAQSIYLKDNLTATIHNLNTGGYAFTSAIGTFANRFEVMYQSQLDIPIFTPDSVVIYSQDNGFVINSGNTIMASVKVFDIRGRVLQEKININASQTTINGGLANEVLLVQITSENGAIVTKKVLR